MSLTSLFEDIDTGGEELAKEELVNNTGGGFIKTSGVYAGTIERAFITETKKGGVRFDLHISGANTINFTLFPVSVKNKKKVTTYQYKGKTMTLQDYKMMKQVIFSALGKAQELGDITVSEEEISFKEYGKDKTMTVGLLTDLTGKEIQFGVRAEEEYNYEDRETDKTQIKTDSDGNPRYKLTLFSVYSKEGLTPIESIKEEEATQIDKDKEFLSGDKAIKKVKLEQPEPSEEDEDEDEDELDF